MIIRIPKELENKLYDSFVFNASDYDPEKQTKKEYTEMKILNYIKNVYKAYVIYNYTKEEIDNIVESKKSEIEIELEGITIG